MSRSPLLTTNLGRDDGFELLMTLLVVVVVAHGPDSIGVVVIVVFMFVLLAPPGALVVVMMCHCWYPATFVRFSFSPSDTGLYSCP